MGDYVRGRPFAKGQSGNPNGRPPTGLAVAEYIRHLAGADGRAYVDQLHAIATGEHKDTRARLTAIGMLLDRGYGRPPQTIDITASTAITTVPTSQLTDHELDVLERICRRQPPPMLGEPPATSCGALMEGDSVQNLIASVIR